ncbi:hypothetical protein VKT23_007687 [Stygiomarasmius scandens]|uniref:Uncharacterized protein n=1 Tax=Marasmiellus scandens TaxID=2682957 RepID=A0ABR1JL58_9AGAR
MILGQDCWNRTSSFVQICRALLHGKSGVFVPKKETRGRPSKAKQHKITEVTPRIIAYVCLQFRFATSNVKSWDERDEDIGYNFKTFYETILDIFALPSERSKALLRFWNQQVFGAPEPRPVIKTESIKFIMVERDPKSRKGYNQPRDRDILQQEMHNTSASSVGGRKSISDWPSVSHAGPTEDIILQQTMVPPTHYPGRQSTPAWSFSDNSPTAILQPITTLLSHNLSGVHSPTVNKSDPQQPVQVPVQEQEPSPPESSSLVAEERTLVNQSPEKARDSDEPLSALYVHAHIHGQFSHLL